MCILSLEYTIVYFTKYHYNIIGITGIIGRTGVIGSTGITSGWYYW